MPTLIINKGTSTKIIPTLLEKTTISPVWYLLEVISETTGEAVYCVPTEESTELQRYNQFTIQEVPIATPLNGELTLNEGRYTYKFYEQSSATNLSPTGLNVVENGILKCIDTSNNTNTEYLSTYTNTEYNP